MKRGTRVRLIIEEVCNVATKLDLTLHDFRKQDELTVYFKTRTLKRIRLVEKRFPNSLRNHFQINVRGLFEPQIQLMSGIYVILL